MKRLLRVGPLMCALLAISIVAAACGDDKKTEAGAGSTATTAASSGTGQYCEKTLKIETVSPNIDFESLTPEQITEETKKFTKTDLQPLAHEIQAVTPAVIKTDIDLLVATVDKIAETGDFSLFSTDPAVEAASKSTHAYDLGACGWAKQDVTTVDYAFNGITTSAAAGPVSFDLKNAGKEMHEMVILKKKAGVTESFDEIVKLDKEEGQKKVDRVGSLDPTKPGDDDYVVVNLEKGDYLVACFLPVGATPELFAKAEAGDAELPKGPPHVSKGMKATFTVA